MMPDRNHDRAEAKTASDAAHLKPVSLSDFQQLAEQIVEPAAWAYISGGSADEITLRANRDSFDRMLLKQRILMDVSEIDTSISMLGHDLSIPIMLAPTASHCIAHEQGELATARGAGKAGALFIVSSFSTFAVEEIAATANGPLWFQLYIQPDRGFTKDLIHRAEAAGCTALVITVDAPVVGSRNREQRSGYSLPSHLQFAHLTSLKNSKSLSPKSLYAPILDPSLTWKDIQWARSATNLPVIIKGITAPDDAEIAVREGVESIVVSNHGGRNLDTMPATIDALPRVMDVVQDAMPVMIDGGILRGTDVVKAIACGAKAVMIGRPYLHGLAVDGEDGVARVIEILIHELKMAMALTGCSAIDEITRSILWDGA